MNSGALAGTPWRRSSMHVPELVHEDQDHEPDGERQPPDPRVRGDRDEHRRSGRDHLELEQESAELEDQEAERDQGRREPAEEVTRSPTAA